MDNVAVVRGIRTDDYFLCTGIISRGSHGGNGNVSEMVSGLASIKPIKDFERCQSRRFIPARLWPLRAAVKCQ